MGRGLSPLQKTILKVAANKYCLYKRHVLEEYYNLIPTDWLTSKQKRQAQYNPQWANKPDLYAKPEFVEWNPHEGRYSYIYAESERVATGRACRRLEKRGLLEGSWAGWNITDAGREVVNGLVVNSTKPLEERES